MKFVCSSCKVKKDQSEFNKNNSCKSRGYDYYCKLCRKAVSKSVYEADKQKSKENSYAWKAKNPEKAKAIVDRVHKKYPHLRASRSAKYRAYKGKASPKWLTESDLLHIKAKYQLAAMFNRCTEQRWEVDHIIPLKGKNVCGLHIPNNLRVIPATENRCKQNKYFGE